MKVIFPIEGSSLLRRHNYANRLSHREALIDDLMKNMLQQAFGSIHCCYRKTPQQLLQEKAQKLKSSFSLEIESDPLKPPPSSSLLEALLDPPYAIKNPDPSDLYVQPYQTLKDRVEKASHFLYPRTLSSRGWPQNDSIEMPRSTFLFMKTTLEGLPPKLHENPPRGGQSAMTVFSFPHSAQTFIQKKIIPTPPTQKFSAYIEKELFASLLFCTQPSYFSPLEAMTEDSLIFPFYEEGDLADNCDLKHPPIATQLRRILCVIEALDTLHSQGYAHNDLKLENILVKKDSAVLTDLGFVSRFNDSHGGSLEYAAPERLLKEQISSPASDIFSLGVLLYQLFFAVHTMEEVYYRLTQNIPDSATLTEPELKKEVCRHRVTPHLYSTMRNFMATRSTTNYLLPISHPLMHLAMQCTAYIPNERPSLATIKKSINDVLTEHTDK